MDQLLVIDGPNIQNGFIRVNELRPGLGADLNLDIAKAHLADGERWWS
jgi:hypothetical protein